MSLRYQDFSGPRVYRDVNYASAEWLSVTAVGDCLGDEIPNGSQCAFDLATQPHVGDIALLTLPIKDSRGEGHMMKRIGTRIDQDGSTVVVLESTLPAVRLTSQTILGTLVFAWLPRVPVRSELSDAVNRENGEFRRRALELMPPAQRDAELARVEHMYSAAGSAG